MSSTQSVKSGNDSDREKTKPKRALTSYNFFFQEERRKILENTKSVGFATLAQAVAKRWKSISKEELAIYAQKAADDKERYKQEMSAWTKSSKNKQWLSEKRRVVEDIERRVNSQQLARDPPRQQPAVQNIDTNEYHRQHLLRNAWLYPPQQNLDNRPLSDVAEAVSSPMNSTPYACTQREGMFVRAPSDHRPAVPSNDWQSFDDPCPPESFCHITTMRQRNLMQEGTVSITRPMASETATSSMFLGDGDVKFAASSTQERAYTSEQSISDDKHHLTFTPGSLSRVFDMSAEELAFIPEPMVGYPPASPVPDEMNPSTRELVERMLSQEGRKRPPANGNNR